MGKITLIIITFFATFSSFAQNLITNGTFDDAIGWTVVNHNEASNMFGSVTIADGVVTFSETSNVEWKHMGIYTSVNLEAGNTYQFDMDMTFTNINNAWGEVWIGQTEPIQNDDYNADDGATTLMRAFHFWDCGSTLTYNGLASAAACDPSTPPNQIDITTTGTYYLIFRAGGETYGTTNVVVDNFSLTNTTLSINNFEIEGLKVYPNPTESSWLISTKDATINAIEVLDLLGSKVISLQPNALEVYIDASSLAPGIYITNISTPLGTTSKKLIKR